MSPWFVVEKDRSVGGDDAVQFVDYFYYPVLIHFFWHVVVVFVVINIVLLPYLIAVLCFAVLYSLFVVWGRSDNSVYCGIRQLFKFL